MRQRHGREAAAEIVDAAIAFGLAEHRDHAARIDLAALDRVRNAGGIVGRIGGNAVNLGDRHGVTPSAAGRVACEIRGDRLFQLLQRRRKIGIAADTGAEARQQFLTQSRIVDAESRGRP